MFERRYCLPTIVEDLLRLLTLMDTPDKYLSQKHRYCRLFRLYEEINQRIRRSGFFQRRQLLVGTVIPRHIHSRKRKYIRRFMSRPFAPCPINDKIHSSRLFSERAHHKLVASCTHRTKYDRTSSDEHRLTAILT